MTYIEKTLTGTINAGTSSITFTDDFITNDSIIDIYFEDDDVVPTEQNQTSNTLTITIETRTTNTDVAVHITNADTIDFENDIESLNNAVEGIGIEIDNINNNILSIGESITELETEKQDKLTAGTNISISNDNVISASGGSLANIFIDTSRILVNNSDLVNGSEYTATENCFIVIENRTNSSNDGHGFDVLINNVTVFSSYSRNTASVFISRPISFYMKKDQTFKIVINDRMPTYLKFKAFGLF